MLAELLLVLSGHPSSFFVPSPSAPASAGTLTISPSLNEYLHPGEQHSLNTLGALAFRYSRIRSWSTQIQRRAREALLTSSAKGKQRAVSDEVDQYLYTLAGSVADALRGYEELIVITEARILSFDPVMVQDQQGYVPLSSIVATFSPWQAPMAALANLVDDLSKEGTASGGRLLELVYELTQTGNPTLQTIFTTILDTLRHLFLTHLIAFLLYGLAPERSSPASPSIALDIGPDPLSPQHRLYTLNEDLLPRSILAATRESILYVGRVAATLRREGQSLPKTLVDELRDEVLAVKGLDDWSGLKEAVQRTRSEVGEWLWKHILTGSQVSEAIDAFGNYFLTRNADYATSVIREITRLRLDKLITANPHSSSSVIRERDLDLVLLRASVGTSAELDRAIEQLHFKMDKGPLRTLLPTTSRTPRKTSENPYREDGGIRDLFSSFLLGTPLTFTTTTSWPLDLFMTPSAIAAYSDIHAYLMALRETHLRVLECWTSLSAAQRARRKWTGDTEGGSPEEAGPRKNLARSAWGTLRTMLFFLDQLQSHLMMDIIDVQHRRLLDQLEGVGPSVPASASITNSLRGSVRPVSTAGDFQRPRSPASSTHGGFDTQTIRSRAPPTPSKSQTNYLDFLTLRQIHARHLSFLREGLLLADRALAIVVRDILETCKRFTGLIERWGGDVLPDLLVEGASGEELGAMVKERSAIVRETAEVRDSIYLTHMRLTSLGPKNLDELISDFFRMLLALQNPSSVTGDASSTNAGVSLSRTARAVQMMQSSRVMSRQTSFSAKKTAKSGLDIEKEERDLEGDALMGRHIEQLLLRLDFNGVLTACMVAEDEGHTNKSVLAPAGL